MNGTRNPSITRTKFGQ